MALEPLRPYWWIPCLLVLGYSVAGAGNRVSATAAAGLAMPPRREARSPDPGAMARARGKKIDDPAPRIIGAGAKRSGADDVIPLLLDWQGRQLPRAVSSKDLNRNIFSYESNPFELWESQRRAEAQRRNDGWQGQGVTLAQASVRQAGSFACELRYGGECPPPPPPPPVAPRFSYELVGVFTQSASKQAAFIDPATRTIVMAKQGEKIGDTPFRVRKFNLTSVEVGADGFTENEKIPLSKKSDDPSGSTNP